MSFASEQADLMIYNNEALERTRELAREFVQSLDH